MVARCEQDHSVRESSGIVVTLESNAMNTFDELVGGYPSNVQALARDARELVLELLPGADETVDNSARIIGYGYGPGYKGMICTLILSKSGVKLGLARGAELADPKQLLEGAGKVHRYVRVETASDLKKPGLKQLMKAALSAWQKRTGQAQR